MQTYKYTKFSLVAYILIYYSLLLLLPNRAGFISNLLSPLGDFCSLCIIGWSLKRQINQNKKVWTVFFISNAFFLLGDLTNSYYGIGLNQETPIPSIGDAFYITSTFLYPLGLILYMNVKSIYNMLRSSFDILIMMVVTATLSWKYVIMPIYQDTSQTLITKLSLLMYPIADLGFLCGALSLYFVQCSYNRNSKTTRLIFTSALVLFSADQIYVFKNLIETYNLGSLIDPLWPVGMWILAIACLWNTGVDTHANNSIHPQSNLVSIIRHRIGIILPYLCSSILIIIISFNYVIRDPIVIGAIITAFLIIIRQVFTLLENQRLMTVIKESNQLLLESKLELEEKNAELKKLNILKEQEAQTDFLTGIYNRRYIFQSLQELFNKMQINQRMLSLLLIDIDEFKQINDKWGHDAGDFVLQQVVAIINNNIRSFDIAGRLGGDEFIVILPDTDLLTAKIIGERLCQLIACENFIVGGEPRKITLSIGATQWQTGKINENMQSIISKADQALYKAKKDGRNRIIMK